MLPGALSFVDDLISQIATNSDSGLFNICSACRRPIFPKPTIANCIGSLIRKSNVKNNVYLLSDNMPCSCHDINPSSTILLITAAICSGEFTGCFCINSLSPILPRFCTVVYSSLRSIASSANSLPRFLVHTSQ